ncbi:expressed unknown protein [Seminavis robusta]|uniref:Uncharacterized protein n=1 Tax=Seminavis robusta TaxID=568900 RepID=A0A9N8HK67_9STRA|nr:expressed unknown protein [Seminavis robusta]|eukprot:Sro814_g206310.1 n/a (370) ;mRNA; r:16165-17503
MNRFAAAVVFALLAQDQVAAFRAAARLSSRGKFGISRDNSPVSFTRPTVLAAVRKTLVLEREADVASYDPLNLASQHNGQLTKRDLQDDDDEASTQRCRPSEAKPMSPWAAASSAALVPFLLGTAEKANAVESIISKDIMNPNNFSPVCPASDGFYRLLQTSVEAIVGREKFIEYGPLIAGGLLRVRLELCVVESFFNEAVGPFIQENGVSWILPLHETVETFLAGSIFALATTFILVGSTKLLTVIITYFDLLVGYPSRTFGGFFYDRALGRPVTLDIGFGPFKTRLLGPTDEVLEAQKEEELVDLSSPLTLLIVLTSGTVRLVGKTALFLREFLEAFDLFVGRYLVLVASFYIGVKFVHFKVFPDFP